MHESLIGRKPRERSPTLPVLQTDGLCLRFGGCLLPPAGVDRWVAEGEAGLQDRSSRPHPRPRRTNPAVEAAVVAARRKHRRGSDWLAAEFGVPARTVSRFRAAKALNPRPEAIPTSVLFIP
jgi:hypothetical protein